MTRRGDLGTTRTPDPAIEKAVCPVTDCDWESPEYEAVRTLSTRSRAIGMWRHHFLSVHTPHPEIVTVRERETPHV